MGSNALINYHEKENIPKRMKYEVKGRPCLGAFLYRQFLTFRGGNSWFFKKECMGILNMFLCQRDGILKIVKKERKIKSLMKC